MSTAIQSQSDASNQIMPAIDVHENEQEYLVLASLPGVVAGALELQYERDHVSLSATRSIPSIGDEPETTIYYRRSLGLPVPINVASIDAALKDGLLTLRLPKAESHRPRRISVRSA